MKESARNVLLRIFRYGMLVLMGVQILLGAAYFVTNLGRVQHFQESSDYLKACSSFLTDEYMGILYPPVLAACCGAERLTSVPYAYFMGILQTAAVFSAVYFLLGVLYRSCRRMRWYLALFLTTIPFVLQMALAVLPYAFALAAFLMMTGWILRYEEEAGGCGKLIGIGGFWLAEALLVPDSFWLGGILLLAVLLQVLFSGFRHTRSKESPMGRRQAAKRVLPLLLTIVLAGGAFQGIAAVTVTPGSYHRIENSFGAAMVSRFVWPNFATNYYFWSEDVKNVMSLDDAVYICQREDAVTDYFGPMMEKAYGREKADRLYLEMAKRCFMDRTKECLTEIGADLRDYLVPTAAIAANLDGSGISATAWNYSRMREADPQLVMLYVHDSLLTFWALLFCSALCLLLGRKTWHSGRKHGLMFAILTVIVYAVWYTMRSNMPTDYKLVLPVILLWYLAAVSGLLLTEEPTASKQQEDTQREG